MKHAHWTALGLGLFLAATGRAEVVHCAEGRSHVAHALTASRAELAIAHPFRILTASVTGIVGSLTLNPRDLREGMALRIAGKARGLRFGLPAMEAWLTDRLAERKEEPGWELVSRAMDLPHGITEARGRLSLRLLADLRLGGASRAVDVPLECQVEAGRWECVAQLTTRASQFDLPRPVVFGIGPRDEVKARGKLTFELPKETRS